MIRRRQFDSGTLIALAYTTSPNQMEHNYFVNIFQDESATYPVDVHSWFFKSEERPEQAELDGFNNKSGQD